MRLTEVPIIYPEIQELDQWLTESGWRRYSAGVASRNVFFWQKKTDCQTLCQSNDSIYINLKAYDRHDGQHAGMPKDRWIFEVELTAEPNDKVWVDFKCYGIWLSDLKDVLGLQVEKLLRAWVAANG